MNPAPKTNVILMADDDDDDRLLTRDALAESEMDGELRFVQDGEELLDYLWHRGKYDGPASAPSPTLILLDLNMPKKDGRQALVEIKADPDLQSIPVAIWTTSEEGEDRVQSQKEGAEAYLIKPRLYAEVVNSIKKVVTKYSPQKDKADAT